MKRRAKEVIEEENERNNRRRTSDGTNKLEAIAEPRVFCLGDEGSPAVLNQDQLIHTLNSVTGEDKSLFYIGSILIEKGDGGELIFKLIAPLYNGFRNDYKEDVLPLNGVITNNRSFPENLLSNVIETMNRSGQLEYILGTDFGDDWKIIVSVDYYKNRPKSAIQLHKDTRGYTLFISLNFNNKEEQMGPEYILNPPAIGQHDSNINHSLPVVFIEDIIDLRGKVDITKIRNIRLPENGVVSFIDEFIHHSTPLLQRRSLEYDELTNHYGGNIDSIYNACFSDQYSALENSLNFNADNIDRELLLGAGFTENHLTYIFDQLGEGENLTYDRLQEIMWGYAALVLERLEGRDNINLTDLKGLGLPVSHIIELPGFDRFSYVGIGTDGYPLYELYERETSSDIQEGEELPNPEENRTFFRTWVQAVPTDILVGIDEMEVYAESHWPEGN